MVKLCENWKPAAKPTRNALLSPRTPTVKQLARPNTSLLLIRARYYDPGLGEFISRDPLGFVDGKSLYRGYFSPGGMDPSGKKTCEHGPGEWVGGSIPAPRLAVSSEPYKSHDWIGYTETWFDAVRIDWEKAGTFPNDCGVPHQSRWTLGFSDSQGDFDFGGILKHELDLGKGFVLELWGAFDPSGGKAEATELPGTGNYPREKCFKFTSYLFVEKLTSKSLRKKDFKEHYNNNGALPRQTQHDGRLAIEGYTKKWKIYTCKEACSEK